MNNESVRGVKTIEWRKWRTGGVGDNTREESAWVGRGSLRKRGEDRSAEARSRRRQRREDTPAEARLSDQAGVQGGVSGTGDRSRS